MSFPCAVDRMWKWLTNCFQLWHELALCGWQDVNIQLLTDWLLPTVLSWAFPVRLTGCENDWLTASYCDMSLSCVLDRMSISSYWLTDCFPLCHLELVLCGWQDVKMTDCLLMTVSWACPVWLTGCQYPATNWLLPTVSSWACPVQLTGCEND